MKNFSLGYYCQYAAATDVTGPCEEGTFCPAHSVWPITCPPDKYCPDRAGAPLICPGGYYCNSGLRFPCRSGTYCPAGTISNNEITGEKTCPIGFYCPIITEEPKSCGRALFFFIFFLICFEFFLGIGMTTNAEGAKSIEDCRACTSQSIKCLIKIELTFSKFL